MNKVDLRPLSLGEILDRTFSLYRQNFVLFAALAGIPRIPSTALSLIQVWLPTPDGITAGLMTAGFYLIFALAAVLAYLFAQGATVLAVSELYLGRQASAGETLRRVGDKLAPLLGVLILNALAVGAGMIFLIFPGVYLMCRLLASVPVTVIESKGPGDAFSRSFHLTNGFAGRAFVVILFYFAVSIGLSVLFVLPFTFIIAANANNPEVIRAWSSVQTVVGAVAEIILTPIALIATSIFYYDLRVRKEAFDLHVMMDPEVANLSHASLRPPPLPEGR